jgi:hypothetical protein
MKTIVWDLDDVFNDLMESWLALAWLEEHPESRIRFDELKSNPPLRELNTTRAEYLASLDRFRLSSAGMSLRPNPLLCEWFERHGHEFHHHILTARPVNCVASAASWVFCHFGRWIRHFHFVPSPRAGESLPSCDLSKADVLQQLGQVDFFVDDSVENVREASEQGICSYLFPQPWNHSPFPVDAILTDLARCGRELAASPCFEAGLCCGVSHS